MSYIFGTAGIIVGIAFFHKYLQHMSPHETLGKNAVFAFLVCMYVQIFSPNSRTTHMWRLFCHFCSISVFVWCLRKAVIEVFPVYLHLGLYSYPRTLHIQIPLFLYFYPNLIKKCPSHYFITTFVILKSFFKLFCTLLQHFPKNYYAEDAVRRKCLHATSSNASFCAHCVDGVSYCSL